MNKQCTKCGEIKAFKFFYASKYGKHGKGSVCKDCCRVNPVLIKITSKKCYTCKQDKEVKHFYYSAGKKDRYGNHCKDCLRKRRLDQEWYNKMKIIDQELAKIKGVYLATFDKGTYVGEGRLPHREMVHKYGRSNVNDGSLTLLKFKVLEYIDDQTKRKERELYWIKKLNPSLNR